MDISDTIVPNSLQINAEDLLRPVTVSITGVERGNAEQPVFIHLAEFPGRTYRPGKSMRRVLVAAWSSDAATYAGRRLTLYNDTTIKFGKDVTGGIRISHMSHIDKPLSIALTVTRGRRASFTVQPLPDVAPVDRSKVDAALTAISQATTTTKLDEIDTYAQQIGIHGEVTDAIEQRRKELA